MKNTLRKKRGGLVLSSLLAMISFSSQSEAAVVLLVDVSDPSAVTFSAEANAASSDTSLNASLEGFTIENFFTSTVNFFGALGGTLSPIIGTTDAYSAIGTFNYSANDGVFAEGDDLSVYVTGDAGADSQVFNTVAAAFGGIALIDYSAFAASLPTPGTTGDVISGYFQSGTADHGEVVGQWRVVAIPEPSSFALCLLGMLGLSLRRSRN